MSVALQVLPAGAYQEEKALMVRIAQSSTDVAVAASATDVQGTEREVAGTAQSFMYLLTTDATAGQLTIDLYHADALAGTYTQVTDDALIRGGDRPVIAGSNPANRDEAPVASIVLDMSVAANQGTIIVSVSPSGRELDTAGNLVSQLKLAHRLFYTTDGSWNGTTVSEIGLEAHKENMPGPDAGV